MWWGVIDSFNVWMRPVIGSKPLMMAVFCLYLWTSNFVFDVIVIIWNRPLKIKIKNCWWTLLSCIHCKMYLFSLSFVLYPGWLHVHPWWCGEHPWEQENWLSVQDLADCAQPVGAMLGEAPQGFSPPFFTPHHAAAQPGPHTGTHWTFEIDLAEQEHVKWKGQRGERLSTNLNSQEVLGWPKPRPALPPDVASP